MKTTEVTDFVSEIQRYSGYKCTLRNVMNCQTLFSDQNKAQHFNTVMTFTHCLNVCEKKMQSSTLGLTSCSELTLVKLDGLAMKTNSPFMILHHYQKVEFIMPKPKQTWVKRNTHNLEFVMLKNAFAHSIMWSRKDFLMTCQYAACNAVEHQVLGQDTGEISPGRGRDGGERRRDFEGSWRWCEEVVQVSETGKDGTWGGWFRGFVFISSWVLPPGVGQYPSHAVSALFMKEEEHTGCTTLNLHNINTIARF